MTSKFFIKNIEASDSNKELGLYQFIITLPDNSKSRVFFTKNPDWKLDGINRLLNVPCPVCRKDYYCNCMSKHADEIERQILDRELITAELLGDK